MKRIFIAWAVLLPISFVNAKTTEILNANGKEVRLVYDDKKITKNESATRWTFENVMFEVVSNIPGATSGEILAAKVNTGRPTALDFVCDTLSEGLYPIFKARDYSGDQHVKNHGEGLFFNDFSPSQYLVFSDTQDGSGEWQTEIELEVYDSSFHDPQYWRNIVCSDDDSVY